MVYQAKGGDKSLVYRAFELVPDIKVQQLALDLNLLPKYTLKYNVGLSILDDQIKYLAKKGDVVPSSYITTVRTSNDNQTKSVTNIIFGLNSKASLNSNLIKFELDGIPKLLKGKAEMKFTFTIDKDGNVTVTQLCLNNGKVIRKQIKNLNLIDKD